ncbi:MAG: hypothetical protein EB072_03155 [Betaproteobacteria bacterium]|nr:hypothetical protein [Betaproteobacteria bacterium]
MRMPKVLVMIEIETPSATRSCTTGRATFIPLAPSVRPGRGFDSPVHSRPKAKGSARSHLLLGGAQATEKKAALQARWKPRISH